MISDYDYFITNAQKHQIANLTSEKFADNFIAHSNARVEDLNADLGGVISEMTAEVRAGR